MSIINSQPLIGSSGSTGYKLQRSVRLRSSASAYFNRTPASAGNRKTWTWSAWVKRGTLGSNQALFEAGNGTGIYTMIWFSSSDQLQILQDNGAGGVLTVTTNALFRDSSSWYHVVVAVDTTQATSNNRTIFYVNGVNQSLTYSTQLAQNADTWVDYTYQHRLGGRTSGASYFDGYLTEINFIDGQALTPSSFGETDTTTGVWKPKAYNGTYGTNGFFLKFADNSAATAAAIGKDSSGNGNNWTPNNISVTAGVTYDSMLDVPTLTSPTNANYATLNPIGVPFANGTVTDGNLKFAGLTTTDKGVAATISISSGTFYWESTQLSNSGASNCYAGIVTTGASSDVNANRVYVRGDGNVYKYGTSLGAVFPTFTNNDVIACAYDRTNNTLALYKNGTLGYTVTGLNNVDHTSWVGGYTTTDTWAINFGQRPFTYTPPTGFVALNTFNLPDSAIPNGAAQFAATTYTGNGSTQSISNTLNSVSFQPDFVWVKGRSGATDHALYDSVRGTTKQLESNTTGAETTESTGLTAFNSGGFSIGALAQMNTNAATYVGWQWKGGGTAVSNTSGSITSQVSANVSAGFSIVTYTGTGANATVGHGLNVTPAMIIVKCRVNGTPNWRVWHQSLGSSSSYLGLNQTAAVASSTTVFNSQSSTTFGIGTDPATNSASAMVAYCFSEVAGFSKFGSYTGNGSTNGPFVYCGFRPRWILYKATGTADAWQIYDTSRNTSNVVDLALFPYATTIETDTTSFSREMDILSNGFKIRGSDAQINTNAATYIYAAFAETPFKNALAR